MAEGLIDIIRTRTLPRVRNPPGIEIQVATRSYRTHAIVQAPGPHVGVELPVVVFELIG